MESIAAFSPGGGRGYLSGTQYIFVLVFFFPENIYALWSSRAIASFLMPPAPHPAPPAPVQESQRREPIALESADCSRSRIDIPFIILRAVGLDWQEIDLYCGCWDRRGALIDDTITALCFQTFIIALWRMCQCRTVSCPTFSVTFLRRSVIRWHSLTGSAGF